jgi:hypothetical protein
MEDELFRSKIDTFPGAEGIITINEDGVITLRTEINGEPLNFIDIGQTEWRILEDYIATTLKPVGGPR